MRRTSALTLVAGLAMACSSAHAQVYSSSPNLPIIDETAFSDTISVSGGPTSIADLNVNLQVEHSFDGDVQVVLQSPYGYISLSTSNGGDGANYLTTRFDQSAPESITDVFAPFDGTFRPEGELNQWFSDPGVFSGTNFTSLASFNGRSADGDWTLWVNDAFSDFTGTLLYWSLEFNYASDPTNPNPASPPPAQPSGTGSINSIVLSPGNTIRFRVDVTPAFLPPSTGIAVSVNASPIGAGQVQLFDDGINDDGVADNNIFGASAIVDAPLGTYSLDYTITDAQNRSVGGSFPQLSIIGPAPACPPFNQPQSFNDLPTAAYFGNIPDNGRAPISFSGPGQVTNIHVSGRLVSGGSDSFGADATIAIVFADGTSNFITPFPNEFGFFDFLDADNIDLRLFTPRPPADIVSIETFDSFDQPGVDAAFQSLCLTFETRALDPVVDFAFSDRFAAVPGASVRFFSNVTTGYNPLSTNLTVTIDLSPIGGGIVQLFDDGEHSDADPSDGFFSEAVQLPADAPAGRYEFTVTATDDQGRTSSTTTVFNVTAPVQWDETIDGDGDAGQLPFSAAAVNGSGPLGNLGGSIGFDDVDMFLINICDPANFSANANDARTSFDTQLWLFRTDGTGVEANDDGPNSSGSLLDGSFVTEPGNYFLAISAFNRDARDVEGDLIWLSNPSDTVRAPDGPAAFAPVATWGGGSFGIGSYVISFTGVCFVGAPICDPDLNQDGNADQGDVDYIINVIAGGDNPTNIDPDFNQDGNSDQGDIDALVNVIAGGNCP